MKIKIVLLAHYSWLPSTFTDFTKVIWFFDDSNEQRIIDNLVFLKELSIFFDDTQEIFSFFLCKINRLPFFEIIIFLCCKWVIICSFSSIPRPFNIIPLCDFLPCVEDIRHNHKITSTNLLIFIIFLYQLMEAEKLGYESIRVFLDVVVIIF